LTKIRKTCQEEIEPVDFRNENPARSRRYPEYESSDSRTEYPGPDLEAAEDYTIASRAERVSRELLIGVWFHLLERSDCEFTAYHGYNDNA
jgi:hypothetical protein